MTLTLFYLMHLSIVSLTTPMLGWVGITGDLTMYFCHFWGMHNTLHSRRCLHGCTDWLFNFLNGMKNAHCVKSNSPLYGNNLKVNLITPVIPSLPHTGVVGLTIHKPHLNGVITHHGKS